MLEKDRAVLRMNIVATMSLSGMCLAVFLLTGCASTTGSDRSHGIQPLVSSTLVSPLLAETLLQLADGETVVLRDPPWQGQVATRMQQYQAASGIPCIRLRLEHQQQSQYQLLCQQPNQLWAIAPVF